VSVASRLRSRLAMAVAAGLLATAGSVVVGAAPAQAIPPGCISHWIGHWEDGDQSIHAYNFWECPGKPDLLQGISIQRYVSPGVWTTVASGMGYADYYCNGHALNIFKVAGDEFFNTCG